MISWLRLSALREKLRISLWFWPSISVTVAIIAGISIPLIEANGGGGSGGFAGTPEGARSVLATVAGSMITVTGLVFSLTVLALQMASSQFTPRLLRTFMSDRGNQAVLSTFLGTFAYSLLVLRSVRSEFEDAGAFVPDVAVTLGLVLTMLSVGMLVYFFNHLSQQLRVESAMAEVRGDTKSLIGRLHSDDYEERAELPEVPDGAAVVPALHTGYLQAVDEGVLLDKIAEDRFVVRLRPGVGVHVTEGTTLAWIWFSTGGAPAVDEELVKRIHSGVHLGNERTLQQDVAFGIRQLADIGVRALSPGVNDPTTAVGVLHELADILAALADRNVGPIVVSNEEGAMVAVPRPTFGQLLSLACDQIRRYGRHEPAVLTEMLRMLTDLAEVVVDEEEREAVAEQVEATLAAADEADLSTPERSLVTGLAAHARAAVENHQRSSSIETDSDEPAP